MESLLAAWRQAKAGIPFEEAGVEGDIQGMRRLLAPKRMAILAHFMAAPPMDIEASILKIAFELDCAPSRVREEVASLLSAGFLEHGLFGVMACPDVSRRMGEYDAPS